MKKCKRCGKEKQFGDFYKHKQMLDGYLSFCKECTKKRVGKHRVKNIDSIREYDRCRGKTEKRLKGNRDRARKRIDSGIKRKKYKLDNSKRTEINRRYRENNKEKYNCHKKIGAALLSGKIIRPTKCSLCFCESEIIHGHHDDYSKPMEVIWICPRCHGKLHRTK